MKINFKSRRLISSLVTVVLIVVGAANPEEAADIGATIYCNALVKCDA